MTGQSDGFRNTETVASVAFDDIVVPVGSIPVDLVPELTDRERSSSRDTGETTFSTVRSAPPESQSGRLQSADAGYGGIRQTSLRHRRRPL